MKLGNFDPLSAGVYLFFCPLLVKFMALEKMTSEAGTLGPWVLSPEDSGREGEEGPAHEKTRKLKKTEPVISKVLSRNLVFGKFST